MPGGQWILGSQRISIDIPAVSVSFPVTAEHRLSME
jgi:hypothetical protein